MQQGMGGMGAQMGGPGAPGAGALFSRDSFGVNIADSLQSHAFGQMPLGRTPHGDGRPQVVPGAPRSRPASRGRS